MTGNPAPSGTTPNPGSASAPVPGGSTLTGSAYVYSVHTLFSEMTHGPYGKGWTEACLFLAERLAEQEAKP